MTDATDKQIAFAKSLGIENPERFSKEALREMIDEKVGKVGKKAKEFVEKKQAPQYDRTSYYVSYAKDICVALIQAGADKPIPCMKTAIDMIKMARTELK